ALKLPEALESIRVADVMTSGRPFVTIALTMRAAEIVQRIPTEGWQDTFPVVDDGGALRGLITLDSVRVIVSESGDLGWTIAADIMQPLAAVRPDDDLRAAARTMLDHGLREVPVVDDQGAIVGFLDEAETAKAYVGATTKAPATNEPR